MGYAFFVQTCTMQTGMPDLPFMNYGNAVFDASAFAKSAPRRYPRTDILCAWTFAFSLLLLNIL